MKTLLSGAALIAFGFCVSTHAATLVNDNFTLSSGSNVGTVSNTSSSGVGTYTTIYQQPAAGLGMTVTTVPGFGSGNVLSLGNNSNTYYRAFDGGLSLKLADLAIDQSLSLSFTARFNGEFASAQNFSFGFVNFTTPASILYANVDLNSGVSEFRYRSGGSGAYNMSDAGTQYDNATWSEPTTVSGTSYTFGIEVIRLVDDITGSEPRPAFSVKYIRDGSVVSSMTMLAGTSSITGIAFRHGQVPGLITYLDDVLVTTSAIPEPATFAFLGGIGALGLAALRRRR